MFIKHKMKSSTAVQKNDPVNGLLRIAMAVCNCPVGDTAANIETVRMLAAEAAENGSNIICFPEMNITGYSNTPEIESCALSAGSPELSDISSAASDLSLVILAGFAEKDLSGKIYATHGVFYPDGSMGLYRKIHIAPPEKGIFSEGSQIPVFEYLTFRFGIQLCYDIHFPELTTRMALNGIDLLFIPHASPRSNPSQKFSSWMRHIPARAFDNGIYAAACNQVGGNGRGLFFPGVSCAVSPSGESVGSILTDKDEILYFDIRRNELDDFRSSRMKYFLQFRRSDIGDLPVVILR
jgi:N-carbamoylputrescine amidase